MNKKLPLRMRALYASFIKQNELNASNTALFRLAIEKRKTAKEGRDTF